MFRRVACTRIALALVTTMLAACSDATAPSRLAVPSGPSRSGGSPAPLPQIAGYWQGTIHFDFAAFGPVDITRPVQLLITQNTQGGLGGVFCQDGIELTSPGCSLLGGRVTSNGAVQFAFSDGSTGAAFVFTGALGDPVDCADGSTAATMGGTFRIREGSGTFDLNSCPA